MMSAFFIVGMAGVARAADSDSDGMSDEYELFYGLNPTNSADALVDYDYDGVTNLQESAMMTDPFCGNTDRDGVGDATDAAPISRAYIGWGNLQFTDGDAYSYAAPAWLLGAYKVDGEWATNPVAWYVSAAESNEVGSLNVDLDRDVLATNNLRYKLTFYDHAGASLYMDLLATNAAIVATNLFGNLITGNNTVSTVTLNVPLVTYPSAAVIHLRRGSGETRVYESLIYIDSDGDGLDREMEQQLNTSDNNPDTDDDSITDYDEVFIYGTDPVSYDPVAIKITSPTDLAAYSTNSASLDIAGLASAAAGLSQVTYQNSRSGDGVCAGTNAWSKEGLTLYWGANVITVTAWDVNSNSAVDTLTISVDSIPEEGLTLWVRADADVDMNTNNQVYGWADQSGNGHNFGSYGTIKPIWQENRLNGKPALKFDGANDYMTNAYKPSGQLTAFIVRRYQAFGAKQSLFNCHKTSAPDGGFYLGAGGASSPYNRQAILTALGGTWPSGVNNQDVGMLSTNWVVDTLLISVSNTALWTDNMLMTNDTAHGAIAAGKPLVVGANSDALGAYPFNGEVAEIVIYNRAMSDDERLLVNDYLGTKYNRPPLVNAGPDLTICLPVSASLNGTAPDDGYPIGSSVTSAWTKVSGPGTVTFANPAALATTASFSTNGVYILRLTASDSDLSASDDLTVTVGAEALAASIPTDGLTVWVKADAGISTNTGGVYGWADQSGNNNNFGSHSTYKPIWQENRLNGKPALKFDGANDYMTNAYKPSGQLTAFIVRRYQAFGAKQSLFNCHKTSAPDGGFYLGAGGASSPYNRQAILTALGGTWPSGVNSQDVGMLSTNWVVDTLLISATNTALWTSAALKTNDGAHGAIAAGKPLVVGANSDALGAYPFNGEVSEILVYEGALSNLGLIQVESYISQKYGVALNDIDRDGDGLDDAWEMERLGTLDGILDTTGVVNLKVFTMLE